MAHPAFVPDHSGGSTVDSHHLPSSSAASRPTCYRKGFTCHVCGPTRRSRQDRIDRLTPSPAPSSANETGRFPSAVSFAQAKNKKRGMSLPLNTGYDPWMTLELSPGTSWTLLQNRAAPVRKRAFRTLHAGFETATWRLGEAGGSCPAICGGGAEHRTRPSRRERRISGGVRLNPEKCARSSGALGSIPKGLRPLSLRLDAEGGLSWVCGVVPSINPETVAPG